MSSLDSLLQPSQKGSPSSTTNHKPYSTSATLKTPPLRHLLRKSTETPSTTFSSNRRPVLNLPNCRSYPKEAKPPLLEPSHCCSNYNRRDERNPELLQQRSHHKIISTEPEHYHVLLPWPPKCHPCFGSLSTSTPLPASFRPRHTHPCLSPVVPTSSQASCCRPSTSFSQISPRTQPYC